MLCLGSLGKSLGVFPKHLFIVRGFLLPAFLDGWILSVYWEMFQDDLRGKRNGCNPCEAGEGRVWVIAPSKSCQEGERPSGPKGQDVGLTPSVLTHPLSGLQLSIYKMHWISKGSSMKAQSQFSGRPIPEACSHSHGF